LNLRVLNLKFLFLCNHKMVLHISLTIICCYLNEKLHSKICCQCISYKWFYLPL
jgi:hypothetical protein